MTHPTRRSRHPMRRRTRLPLATRSIALAGALLFASSFGASSDDRGDITLYFENDICLRVAADAPELVEVRTTRRFSLEATRGFFLRAVRFELALPSASENVSLRIAAAYVVVGENLGSYFGRCSFIDGIAGFQRQVDGRGVCTVVGHTDQVYHSAPGSRENVIVRCRPEWKSICNSMTIFHDIGSVQVEVNVSMREPAPNTWMPISQELREFLDQHVSHLADCKPWPWRN